MLKRNIYIILLTLLVWLSACNEGLAPPPAGCKTYLNGLITYKGGKSAWPKDSVYDIRVAAFKNYPFKDNSSIFDEIASGNAYFNFTSLPLRVDTSGFSFEIKDTPVDLKYIAVALQYDSTTITAQKVIGLYTITGDRTKPSSIIINKCDSVFINIIVDFDSLPPQPFH
ncbi:MAG: hypothetical protein ABSG15_02140 [FCB group bacterium]|jgi:hypothetical protein